jgi:hypothetical protein
MYYRVYEALGREDIPALLELLAEDVVWVYQGPSVIPFAGTHHGREGVGEDNVMPPAVNQSNVKHYRTPIALPITGSSRGAPTTTSSGPRRTRSAQLLEHSVSAIHPST